MQMIINNISPPARFNYLTLYDKFNDFRALFCPSTPHVHVYVYTFIYVSIRSGNPYRFRTIPPLTSRVRTPTRPVCSSVTRSVKKKKKIIPCDLYCSSDVSSMAVGIVCFWLGTMYSRKRRCAYQYFDYSPIIFFFRLRGTNDRGRNCMRFTHNIHKLNTQYIILLSCRPPAGIQCIKNTSICRPVYEYRLVLYRNS